MGRPRKPVPAYSHHKPSNQARIRVAGKDIYLGEYGSAESKKEYDRIRAELEASSPAAPAAKPGAKKFATITVAEVVEAFLVHALNHYRDGAGACTSEVRCLKYAVEDLAELYGHVPACEFGPKALKALRERMVGKGHARTTVNARVNRVRRVFKWAASEELVPVAVYQALMTVEGLGRNRTKAREPSPVEPVPDLHVAATLPFLNPVVRAMVLAQRLTGMRPQDVVRMRAGQVDRSSSPWVCGPPEHKTAYRGDPRLVWIARPAQEVIAPFLEGKAADDVVFEPAEAKRLRYAALRAARKTKVQPSQVSRAKPARKLLRKPAGEYLTVNYAKAVRDAAKRAGVPHWHPNQLRHSFGTEVRALFGLEAAQVLLGHTKANVTQVYAQRDQALAVKVASALG